jgi:hypothetical protein
MSNYYREDYFYNISDQLIYKNRYAYAGDSIGWYLSDSTAFFYENGKLSTELQFQFSAIIWKVMYIYGNERLWKKFEFWGDQFNQLTIFEYDSIHCIKEIACHDSIGNNPFLYTYHTYNNNLLSGSESFYMNIRPIQKVNYYYNKNDLLITEESIQLYSESPYDLNYVYRK